MTRVTNPWQARHTCRIRLARNLFSDTDSPLLCFNWLAPIRSPAGVCRPRDLPGGGILPGTPAGEVFDGGAGASSGR